MVKKNRLTWYLKQSGQENTTLNVNSESISLFINISTAGVFTIINHPNLILITIISVKYKFRINISLQNHSNCWFIHNNKTSKPNTDHDHIGHFKIDLSHIHTSYNLLPKDKITVAKQCSQLNVTN